MKYVTIHSIYTNDYNEMFSLRFIGGTCQLSEAQFKATREKSPDVFDHYFEKGEWMLFRDGELVPSQKAQVKMQRFEKKDTQGLVEQQAEIPADPMPENLKNPAPPITGQGGVGGLPPVPGTGPAKSGRGGARSKGQVRSSAQAGA